MWIFEKAQEDEIMFIASNLKTKVCMADEKVIIRGDITDDVFFILSGTVDIRMQENSTKDLAGSNKAIFKAKDMMAKKLSLNLFQQQKQNFLGNKKVAILNNQRAVEAPKEDKDENEDLEGNALQDKLQRENKNPNVHMPDIQLYNMDENETSIDILIKGDMFGELAALTNSKRTCTVATRECCIFQTLSRDSMDLIGNKYPSIFDNIVKNMQFYADENMTQKCQFVQNIPYLRNLPRETIIQIVFLMREYTFDIKDYILS